MAKMMYYDNIRVMNILGAVISILSQNHYT